MNYKNICDQAILIIQEVGQFIVQEAQKFSVSDIETKSLNSFVTYVDKTSEEQLVTGLQKLIPGCGFITEEETISIKGDIYNWIIDPLDGTTNFIHKLSPFAISVALTEDSETVLGIVFEINRNECFYSYKGGKAYLNRSEIKVSDAKKVEDALVATGFPYYDFSILKPYLSIIEELTQKTQGIRRMGSAATDLAYVACGRFDVFFEYSLNPWDVAAGAFIVQQAGGYVSDFSGKENYIFGKEIIASNSFIHDEFQKIVSSKLN
jgi:myo-inositol-1(or 4)-monophosphatase